MASALNRSKHAPNYQSLCLSRYILEADANGCNDPHGSIHNKSEPSRHEARVNTVVWLSVKLSYDKHHALAREDLEVN